MTPAPHSRRNRGDRATAALRRAAILLVLLALAPGIVGTAAHLCMPRSDPAASPPWPSRAAGRIDELRVRTRVDIDPPRSPPAHPLHSCLSVPDYVLALHSLAPVSLDGKCRIAAGSWNASASGRRIDSPRRVTAEPVVPLAIAASSGLRAEHARRWVAPGPEDAWLWMPMRRETAASRGGRGIEAWRPAGRRAACAYAAKWTAAKVLFRLSVTPGEKRALETALAACPRH